MSRCADDGETADSKHSFIKLSAFAPTVAAHDRQQHEQERYRRRIQLRAHRPAVLLGAGALLLPWIRLSRGTPGWAKATAGSAIIVGLIGVLLAVLTVIGVFGGHLTAPAGAS